MSNNICIHCDRRIRYNEAWHCYETVTDGNILCVGNDDDTARHADQNNNAVREEGCDRCVWCGCKYWENDACTDCGGTVPEYIPAAEAR